MCERESGSVKPFPDVTAGLVGAPATGSPPFGGECGPGVCRLKWHDKSPPIQCCCT
jgi:hypothetical protein